MAQSPEQSLMIVITGTVGSGKSTTASELHELLTTERVPNAFVDMDHLRYGFPEKAPFNCEMGYRNLTSVVANYRSVGIDLFILADVVESSEQVAEYRRAAPDATIAIVRLSVPLDVIERRLHQRETLESLQWHLARAPELELIQTSRNVGDLVIDVTNQSPAEVAREIFDRLELGRRTRLP